MPLLSLWLYPGILAQARNRRPPQCMDHLQWQEQRVLWLADSDGEQGVPQRRSEHRGNGGETEKGTKSSYPNTWKNRCFHTFSWDRLQNRHTLRIHLIRFCLRDPYEMISFKYICTTVHTILHQDITLVTVTLYDSWISAYIASIISLVCSCMHIIKHTTSLYYSPQSTHDSGHGHHLFRLKSIHEQHALCCL